MPIEVGFVRADDFAQFKGQKVGPAICGQIEPAPIPESVAEFEGLLPV